MINLDCIKHFLVISGMIESKIEIDSGTDLGYGSSCSPHQTNADFTDEDSISLGGESKMSADTVIENPYSNKFIAKNGRCDANISSTEGMQK